MEHPIAHIEWTVLGLDRCKVFYMGMFGWEFSSMGTDYLINFSSDGPSFGLMKTRKEATPGFPVVYLEVDDLKKYLERVKELGGKVSEDTGYIPDKGYYAHVIDPDGNMVGLFQPQKQGQTDAEVQAVTCMVREFCV